MTAVATVVRRTVNYLRLSLRTRTAGCTTGHRAIVVGQ